MQKTQVFALESYGARTRLTHSLEVAHVGTFIVDKIFTRLTQGRAGGGLKGEAEVWSDFDDELKLAIRSFVEVACLVHDIGNPPFGHFGEKAISHWFRRNMDEDWYPPEIEGTELNSDFVAFDGNKQGFRIITKLQRNSDDEFGLNLTGTQLASLIKYPIFNKSKPAKCGFFQSESAIKDEVWQELGLSRGDRHPLSLIMEAADDIAYCVSDIEDAYEKKLVSDDDLVFAFGEKFNAKGMSASAFTAARTSLTTEMVELAAQKFVERLSASQHFSNESILDDEEPPLSNLKAVAAKRVYSSRLVLANEVTGFKVIEGILDAFLPIILLGHDDFFLLAKAFRDGKSIYEGMLLDVTKRCTEEPGVLALFPKKHLAVYVSSVESNPDCHELFFRLHLVIDFVAGMTDNFALEMYRLLNGHTTHERKN